MSLNFAFIVYKNLSHLILMNAAPAPLNDDFLFRPDRLQRPVEDMEMLKAIRSTTRYEIGDLETDLLLIWTFFLVQILMALFW